MTTETEAHRLFREAVYAYGGMSMAGENEDRAASIIAAALKERDARIGGLETFASIIAWGDEIFGPCTQERAIERAWEEWQEMISPGADVPIEAADVIIVLLRIPGIADAIQRKMAINRKRQWNFRGDGTGYHIPAQALEADNGA